MKSQGRVDKILGKCIIFGKPEFLLTFFATHCGLFILCDIVKTLFFLKKDEQMLQKVAFM